MTTEDIKSVVVGDEYDERLRQDLGAVLRSLGARINAEQFGVAGSQELLSLTVNVRNQRLMIEAETYVGLSVSGPAALVDEIVGLVQQRRRTG